MRGKIVCCVSAVLLGGCNIPSGLDLLPDVGLFPGESCEEEEEPWEACITGFTCSSKSGTCVEMLSERGAIPEGFNCAVSEDCAYGLVCDHAGICRQEGEAGTTPAGGACDDESDCQHFLACPEGVCDGIQPVPWEGAVCSAPPGPGEEALKVYFEVPGAGDESDQVEFYRLPFPNDIRLRDGRLDLTGHANPGVLIEELGNPVDEYMGMLSSDVDGFGTQSAVFLRFNYYPKGETLLLNETIFLMDIDPDSPAYGYTHSVGFRSRSTSGSYICHNWLAVNPGTGSPLLPSTTYAVIMTNGITDTNGRPMVKDWDFEAMLTPEAPTDDIALAEAWRAYAPLRAYLDDDTIGKSITYDNIAVAAVFTTGDPTSKVRSIRTAVRSADAPEIAVLETDDGASLFTAVRGTITVPYYQAGTRPFFIPEDGGAILWDGGAPVRQETEPVNFALTLPRGEVPDAGWPVFLYGHGTGGSETSFIENGVASRLAAMGVAGFSMEQVQHGERRRLDPEDADDEMASPESLFYNFINPKAARDNNLQAAAELFQAVRFIEGMDGISGIAGGLDPERVFFFGHSQGAQGSFLGAVFEPAVKGFVLSGAGGFLIESLLGKKKPVDLSVAVGVALADIDVNRYHPVLNLMQAAFDVVDPVNYGPLIFARDPTLYGLPKRSVFMSAGIDDNYTPEKTQYALARAIGLYQSVTSGGAFEGLMDAGPLPVSGTFDPSVTGVVVRYAPLRSDDGHFVMFNVDEAIQQSDAFIRTMVDPDINPPVLSAAQ